MKKTYMIAAIIFVSLMVTSTSAFAATSGSRTSVTNQSLPSGDSQPATGDTPQDLTGTSNPSSPSVNDGSSISLDSTSSSGISRQVRLITVTISPNPAYPGQDVNFAVYVNNRSKGFAFVFTWEYGDGEISKNETLCEGIPFWYNTTHSYKELGSYSVKLYVTDKDGKRLSNYSGTVDVLPIFVYAGGPYAGKVNEKVSFRGSIDADASEDFTYQWDFGDGCSGVESSSRHAYSVPGIYTATFYAQDENGNVLSDSTTVVIGKLNIVILPSNPTVNEEVIFGVDVLGFIPTSYQWDFGDGTTKGSGQCVTHIYGQAKTYYGKVKVYATGTIKLSANFVLTVDSDVEQNMKPVPIFTVSSVGNSYAFEFDASDSYDINAKIISYEWYFGDGSMLLTTNSRCNYVYEKAGVWTVTCVVGNNYGGYDSFSKTVTIADEGSYEDGVMELSVTNGGSGTRTLGTPIDGGTGSQTSDGTSSGSIPSSKTTTASVGQQDGVVFFAGTIQKGSSTTEIAESKNCDLYMSVSSTPSQPDSGKIIVFHATVTDRLGNYNGNSVNIKLNSDISGYDDIDYYAEWDSVSKSYSVDINMLWPDDTKPYVVTLKAVLGSGYYETDWHGNRWSEVLSGKSAETGTNQVAIIPNNDIYTGVLGWGSFSL